MPAIRPSFLGIGAHKAGTSWLHHQLGGHPEVWIPPRKELHYFDRSTAYPSPNDLATTSLLERAMGSNLWERPRVREGLQVVKRELRNRQFDRVKWKFKWYFGHYNDRWYCSLFSDGRSFNACGEITPSYSILHKDDVARIKRINPDMKFIFMIRHPIQRAWSAIRFNVSRKHANIDINSVQEVIEAINGRGMLLRGDYIRTLETYLDFFDSKQILVGFFDAIILDPENLIKQVTTFLDISPPTADSLPLRKKFNTSPKHPMPDQVYELLQKRYGQMIEQLADHLGSYAATWKNGEHSTFSANPLPPAVHP